MVKTAVSDVIGPSVSADAPYTLFDKAVHDGDELFSLFRAHVFQLVFELFDLLPEFTYLSFGRLGSFKDRFYKLLAKYRCHLLKKFSRVFTVLVYRHAEAKSKFGCVFE